MKVDLDRYSVDVRYQILPDKFVPFEKRTFSSELILGENISKLYPNKMNSINVNLDNVINIYGWKRSVKNSTIDIETSLIDFIPNEPKIESRTEDFKGENGKITKFTYYYVTTKFVTKGFSSIKFKDSLSATKIPFSNIVVYKSNENTSLEDVKSNYEENKQTIFKKHLYDFVEGSLNTIKAKVNNLYGLVPTTFTDKMWIIDSKEEEGAIQKEAIEAVKIIFSRMTADKPIDDIKNDLIPLIEYFESLKTKYTGNDKPSQKIRYSAFYNLGRIYIHIDEPEKAIKEGKGLIENGYDKKDGEKIIKDANHDLSKFINSQYKSKHNLPFN
jgi:hypothetical protein